MNGMQYFAIGAGSAAIVIIVVYMLILIYRAFKRLIVWVSGKVADLFFGHIPGGRP